MDWNLITDPPGAAPHNMAKDEHLLRRAAATGNGVVRLYGWQGFVLSVGRNQRVEREIDLAACRELGIPLIRRATGGRAVLHGSDLTYSVTAPSGGGPFGPGILAVYREISKALQGFFRELGFEPQVKAYSGRERLEMASPVCFATPSAFEIMIGGRKIVGSAQRLLPDAFLQHGSLPLAPQGALLARIFKGVSQQEVEGQMTDLATLGVFERMGGDDLRPRLVRAFEGLLGTPLNPAQWGAEDRAVVASLEQSYPLFTGLEKTGEAPRGPSEPAAAGK